MRARGSSSLLSRGAEIQRRGEGLFMRGADRNLRHIAKVSTFKPGLRVAPLAVSAGRVNE